MRREAKRVRNENDFVRVLEQLQRGAEQECIVRVGTRRHRKQRNTFLSSWVMDTAELNGLTTSLIDGQTAFSARDPWNLKVRGAIQDNLILAPSVASRMNDLYGRHRRSEHGLRVIADVTTVDAPSPPDQN